MVGQTFFSAVQQTFLSAVFLKTIIHPRHAWPSRATGFLDEPHGGKQLCLVAGWCP